MRKKCIRVLIKKAKNAFLQIFVFQDAIMGGVCEPDMPCSH